LANLESKATTIAITLFLMLAMAVSLVVLPVTNVQAATTSYAYISATPNPVGVGQEVLLHVGVAQQLQLPRESWKGLTVTVTKPDGTTETLGGTDGFKTDPTGGTGTIYVPTMEGTYKFQTHFPAQSMNLYDFFGNLIGTKDYAADASDVVELIVQAEQIPYYPGVPLPTEYWTRPINAQFHEWAPLAGNWLRPAGGYTMPPIPKYHPYNYDAPETGHILWTKPYAQGGLTGGELGEVQYEMGDAYEGKFSGSVIIDGVLYYNRFQSQGGSNVDQDVVAMNLKTGEELWIKNWDNLRLAFGQVYYFDSWNYHGAFAYLWTTEGGGMSGLPETWHAYDALTGRWCYSMTDIPSGWNLYGPTGILYRYTVNLANGWMTLWNSSKVVQPQTTGGPMDGSWQPLGNTYNATTGIEWNVTIPTGLPGFVCAYFLDDRIFGTTSGGMGSASPTITTWAISAKPGDEGRLIFNKTWTAPQGDITFVWTDASTEDGVFIISGKEAMKYYGFSLDTGNFMWETEPETHLALYDKWYGPAYAYGKFYTGRQSGIVTCYEMATGKKLWTYDVKDKYAEILWSNNFPIEYHFITDDKIYLSYGEHSPINPNGRGAPFVCLNATTGEEIWTLSWANNWWGGHAIIGDSIIAGMNAYDNRLYAIGKGPSATTITAAPKISVHGDSVLVEGMVN
jgi:outer membrane protein assembly factor BamB